MRFTEAKLAGVWVVDVEPRADLRGFFARTFCRDEFAAHGLRTDIVQASVSYNHKPGTLRGMHYQSAPFEEVKLVRCVRGAIYDVVLDLRATSPTFCRWEAFELTEDNLRAVYVPEGCAHGFQTLREASLVAYQISPAYSPEHARGVAWDDPAFGIAWPEAERTLSERDRVYPRFAR